MSVTCLVFASCTRHCLRNAVMVLLSAKAGLRAGEIAKLTWDGECPNEALRQVESAGAFGEVVNN
jgi:hypothetical protein